MELSNKETSFRGKDFLNYYCYLFLFSIAFIPRPTIENNFKYLAPVAIILTIYIFLIWFWGEKKDIKSLEANIGQAGLICFAVLSIYYLRIVINQNYSELSYLISLCLSYSLTLIILYWLNERKISLFEVYKVIFISFLALSCLIIFIGFTGISLFGELRPARTYGFVIPFYKTTGIPRSYGEFGIFAAVSWAYFLVTMKRYKNYLRILLILVILLSLIISQSRSSYLAIFLVICAFFFTRRKLSQRRVYSFIIIAICLPLIVEIVILPFKNFTIIDSIVSEGIYEENIYGRLSTYSAALNMIIERPDKLILGINHTDWTNNQEANPIGETNADAIALHNHYLSDILFLGIIGGLFSWLLFLIPILRMKRRIKANDKEGQLIFLVLIGLIASLQFYEGFFSIIAAVVISTIWYSTSGFNN